MTLPRSLVLLSPHLCYAIAAATWLFACGAALAARAPETLTSAPIPGKADWQYALDAQNRAWLAYYDDKRRLLLRSPEGDEQQLSNPGQSAAPSGLAIVAMEKGAATMWRDKQPTKGLYLALTGDNRTVKRVGAKTEPLARFFARSVAERLDLLWYGERAVENSPSQYHLYYRQFVPGTNKLGEVQRLLPGYYPAWSGDPSGGLVVYSWSSVKGDEAILARGRPADKDTFNDAVKIADVPQITPILKGFHSAGRHFVVWAALYNDQDPPEVLEAAYSDDNGATWARVAFDSLRGVEVTTLQIAADQKGHIVIAVSGKGGGNKRDVWAIQSADNGSSWSEAVPLRPEALRTKYNAEAPSVAFGAKTGEVVVVWEDWREIRSRLYAATSSDFGKTWAETNLRLPQAAGLNTGLSLTEPSLYAADGEYHVIAEQATDDSMRTKSLVRVSFDIAELLAGADAAQGAMSPSAGAPAVGEADLRPRIESFWQAMVQDEYPQVYRLYDPFFRARNPEEAFVGMTGKIDYTSFDIKQIEIDGPIATVSVSVKASVPPFKIERTGETVSRPEKEIKVTSNWLWIDDAWYREFRFESHDLVYTGY